MRTTLSLLVGIAATVAVLFSASDASAFGHRHGGSSGGSSGGNWGSSGGSYGSWGSSGGSWGSSGGSYGSWSSFGSSGSSGGTYRVHRHRGHSSGGNYGSWGSSGGNWGSSGGSYYGGSSGGSSGGWGSSGGSYSVPADVTPSDDAPAAPTTPATPTPPAPAAEGSSASMGSAMLYVSVPADAKVFVNGKLTTSTGTERQFVSRGLVEGANYNFEVKAELMVDGKPVTLTKTAQLTSGTTAALAFDATESDDAMAAKDNAPVATSLTVHVPANAKVFLAGNETKQTGEVREFTTNRLSTGNGWNNYTVRAEVELDGQMVVKEQTVSIKAGESKDIAFDFNANSDLGPIAKTARN